MITHFTLIITANGKNISIEKLIQLKVVKRNTWVIFLVNFQEIPEFWVILWILIHENVTLRGHWKVILANILMRNQTSLG